MNNNIGSRIKKIREDRGISQEAMALELEITQSNYGRLEKNDSRLTVPKIQKIAKVLDVTVAYLFDEKFAKIISQHNNENDNVQAYNYIETVVNADKEHINSLKEEIAYLRGLLKEKS